MTILDDQNIIKQFDANDSLGVGLMQTRQAKFEPIINCADNDGRKIHNIVIAGMGGSALAALIVKTWLKSELNVPFEIVRTYNLPDYVDHNTLVITSSYSGNTEETVNCLHQALERDAQIGIIASGGKLVEEADKRQIAHVVLPEGIQPRMAVIYNLRGLVSLMVSFGMIEQSKLNEIAVYSDWLHDEASNWAKEIPLKDNYAKQLASHAVGKTAVFYGGALTAPIAYKWKISWNENAKNVAFWNEYPELNHNEFLGWTSHPVEKPFAIFDIVSHFEHPQILKRFEISEKLLSGMRPKAKNIELKGDSLIAQMLWGCILADFVSIYLAVLNGINPTPVTIIERLKKELA